MATETELPAIPSLSFTRHEPLGVVGIISPWNLPLYLFTWKIAPALAMGNCVVAKPSEFTSLTAYKFAGIAKEAGVPDGVLNFVFGCGGTAGQMLVEHRHIRAVSFTGGTTTGRKIAGAASHLGKKVSLELGGKNPSIIFADCDLENAIATSVRAAFTNQGEICLCCSRILVERSIFDTFLQRFVEKVTLLKVGNPLDPDTDVGALVSKVHHSKVYSYVELAKEENATIHCGGTIPTIEGFEKGHFLTPTVISGLKLESRLLKEEIFGPVVCVVPFDSEEDAIHIANDVDYGLAASVWTNDGRKGQRVGRQVKTGIVWINCWMVRDLATPFGGVKASGYGREGGTYALEFFSDIKTITTAL
jgi:aminomuconate-semialdehyde/2-hydroxymuconate-6-semialdehyde dehydrogenase